MPSLLLVVALACAEPQDLRGEFEVAASALAVSPSGDLWLGTLDGRAFVSRDWNRSWSEVDVGPRTNTAGEPGGERITCIRFFDAERAILAGYLGLETKNEILRTTDGGRTWVRVPLGVPHGLEVRVADAQVLADGHAWLVGSTGVLVSQDFGASWHYVAGEPFEGAASCRSVCFCTPEIGVVGADGNALSLTTDGGRTWTWLATPVDELYPAEAHDPGEPTLHPGDWFDSFVESERAVRAKDARLVKGVWCLGGRLLVLQRHQLFQRAFEREGKWSAIDSGGRDVIAAVLDGDRQLVVSDDLRVSWLSSALECSQASWLPLDERPQAIAAGRRGAAFLTDVHGCVCTLSAGQFRSSWLMARDGVQAWVIGSFDRTTDGTLFGTSHSALYRSSDSGQRWERLGEGRGIGGVFAAADASHALVFDRGEPALWSHGEDGLAPLHISDFPLLALTVRARKGRLWIATAFDAAKDARTQVMLRTSDTTFVGPQFKAFVFASADEGLTWSCIDESVGATIQAAWLGKDDVLRVCLTGGTVRGGALDPHSGKPMGGALETLGPPQSGLAGNWGSWLAFPDAQTGWAGGMHFFDGNSLFRSRDGGRSWNSVEQDPEARVEAFRLGDGSCARTVSKWNEGSRVELWRAGEFDEIRRFEAREHDARVDASGCLLVRLENAEVWRLAADGDEWTKLGTIDFPPR